MKKHFLIIPILGLFLACTNGEKQTGENTDKSDPETEALEKSSKELEQSIQKSETEFKKAENEIDSLLNAI